MEVTRYVFLFYAACLITLGAIYIKVCETLWNNFDFLPQFAVIGQQITVTDTVGTVLAIATTFWAYRKPEYLTHVTEVVIELKKVTWPTFDETKRATLVVTVFSIITGLFLFGSDRLWRYLTDLILVTNGA